VKKSAVKKSAVNKAPAKKAAVTAPPAEPTAAQPSLVAAVASDPVDAVRVIPAPVPSPAPVPRPTPAVVSAPAPVAPRPDEPTARRRGPEPLTPGSSLYFEEDVTGTVRILGPAAWPSGPASPGPLAFRAGTVETTERATPDSPRPTAAPPSNGRAPERPPGERRPRPLRAT
jgi:hypothetical protein